MIGWIIAGLLAASVAVIVIDGIIHPEDLRKVAKSENLENALVKQADKANNVVTLADVKSGREVKVQGAGISDNVKAGMKIQI